MPVVSIDDNYRFAKIVFETTVLTKSFFFLKILLFVHKCFVCSWNNTANWNPKQIPTANDDGMSRDE
jgi:hypothetical protein